MVISNLDQYFFSDVYIPCAASGSKAAASFLGLSPLSSLCRYARGGRVSDLMDYFIF